MNKHLAVATTAAFLLAGAGLPASAQDETITVEGVVYFDHNFNEKNDAGDTVRANGLGVTVTNIDAGGTVGEFRTDADGRYQAVLPKGPRYMVILEKDGFDAPWGARPTSENLTLDFALHGSFINGFSFVDANGDGVKQDAEDPAPGEIKASGKTADGKQIDVAAKPGADGSFRFELQPGAYVVTAPDLVKEGLALAKPLGANDIDWLTGQANAGAGNTRVDLRYFKPKADAAVEEFAVTPAKAEYTVGDQADVKIKLTNKGDNPGALSFAVYGPVEFLKASDNVRGLGNAGSYETVAKLLPGESVTVDLKIEFPAVAGEGPLGTMVRPFIGGHPDVDRSNQGPRLNKLVKVVEKSTTTPTTPTSETTPTTTTPTTTTTPAVAKAGNKTGLALTGASPLGFLGLGALLLAAGLSAFFVARRRRS
ncbi:hypothetical protein ABZX92_14640 [Lentzea sp. NPDC006480]|uniref:hypothetical protein n=1 Tax=Lentzea sp. NPDC006480 TaxID=3157176 RepID=UPI0033ABC1C0